MKITFVLPGRGRSGGVRSTVEAANGLLQRNHQVRLSCLKQMPSPRSYLKNLEQRIFFRNSSDWTEQFQGEVTEFRDLRECVLDSDEILVAVGMAMSAEFESIQVLPNPKVQYIHGTTPWANELMQKAFSLPLPKIVVASYLKRIIEKVGSGKVLDVVHNGVHLSEYYPSCAERDRDGIGFIYSSAKPKDPITTIAVIRKLRELEPKLPIRVFGTERKPTDLNEVEYTRLPSLERARQIYSRSLVWIVASSSEGFSLPVLEGMACGCAIVATDCGGTADIINDGSSGFLVGVGDVTRIVGRVGQLLQDRHLREEFGRVGLRTVEQFTWEMSVRKLESALYRLSECDYSTTPPASTQLHSAR